MNAVETVNLVKKYKTKTAVNGLNLSVKEGELFALLGVNGAGKTTTVRMLCCLSEPSGGECFVSGYNCVKESVKVKQIVGISPQDTSVADNLTVTENLRLMCGIYGYSEEDSRKRISEIKEIFSLDDVANSRAKTLSGGWKRKLSIAMAMISKPRVLFLDEPTLGLDVLARRELWSVVKSLKGKITIVLTTHHMEEAEELADRIGIMIEGNLAALGTLEELEKRTGKNNLEDCFVEIAEECGKKVSE